MRMASCFVDCSWKFKKEQLACLFAKKAFSRFFINAKIKVNDIAMQDFCCAICSKGATLNIAMAEYVGDI